MKQSGKLILIVFLCLLTLVLAVGVGSVYVPPGDAVKIMLYKATGLRMEPFPGDTAMSILWSIRVPRVLLSFLVGAALSMSGAVMQSVLRNPMASSYTLGVSSGAALGAGFTILLGVSVFGSLTLPIFGLVFGIGTVFLAVAVAGRIDRGLSNVTVVLTGMAFSLFANAILTLVMALARENVQQLVFWQMGSFALKDFSHPASLLPVVVAGLVILMFAAPELDMMAFGEEQAAASGVEVKRLKWLLLGFGALMTGFSVALVGIIGFVDLFTPHVARRLFGARHRWELPASALLGGCFMVLCDLVARTIVAPLELPVGAVASAIGAPFFVFLFFKQRKGAA